MSDDITNSNYKKKSIISFANSGCELEYIEKYKKYIFSENGIEIIYQIKYLNIGNSDNCILKINIQKFYNILNAKIEGGNNLNYKIDNDIIVFNFNLNSNDYAILSYNTFNNNPLSMFCGHYSFYIEKKTKYIIRARQPMEIFGTEYGGFQEVKQKNGALYYYYNDDYYDFYEIVYFSAYGIKFSSDFSVSLDFLIGRILKYITVPNLHEFGNNKILSNKIISNLKGNEYNIENNKRFITITSKERYKKFNFTFSKIFQSKIDYEWVLDGVDLVDTCTPNIKNKVLDILSTTNSKEKDYITLGKWVYKNIKYKKEYTSEKWTPEQILEKKAGVCSHITRLYNAFLNCINIDAMYTKGFAYTGLSNNIDTSETLHAWTTAKIDGKWIPLDATWNFFNGKLPSGFIFRYYGDTYRQTDVDWGLFGDILSNMENDVKLASDSNPHLDLKIRAISFLSRELEDDDEGDFNITFDNNNMFIIIILSVIALITAVVLIVYCRKKKKRNNEKNKDLKDISMSINE